MDPEIASPLSDTYNVLKEAGPTSYWYSTKLRPERSSTFKIMPVEPFRGCQFEVVVAVLVRGSSILSSHPLLLQPARRREERRQRPQRHTTVVSALDHNEALVASIKKGESTGGLNRTLHPHSASNLNSRWSSTRIEVDPTRISEYYNYYYYMYTYIC